MNKPARKSVWTKWQTKTNEMFERFVLAVENLSHSASRTQAHETNKQDHHLDSNIANGEEPSGANATVIITDTGIMNSLIV